VVGFGPVLVEEGVAGPFVGVGRDVLAQLPQLGHEPIGVPGGEVVVPGGHVDLHGGREVPVVRGGVGPRDEPVGRDHGGHGVGALGGQHQGQPAPHAEPDDTDMGPAGPAPELVDGPAELGGGTAHVDRHHLLGRLVGLGEGHLSAVVEVGGEGGEPGVGEPVAGPGDLVDDPPPLLEDDDPGTRVPLRFGEVPAGRRAVAREFDGCAHGGRLPQVTAPITGRRPFIARSDGRYLS